MKYEVWELIESNKKYEQWNCIGKELTEKGAEILLKVTPLNKKRKMIHEGEWEV